jgi:Mg-chelatase subunit ChlD
MAATYGNEGIGVTGVLGNKAELYYAQSYTVDESGDFRTHTTADWIESFHSLINADVKVINLSMGYADTRMTFAASRGNANAQNTIRQNAKPLENALKRLILNGKEFVICAASGNGNSYKWGDPPCEYFKDDKEPFGYRDYDHRTLWESIKGSYWWHGEWGDVESKWGSALTVMEDESVKSRIIVVGALNYKTVKKETRYEMAEFSNVGERVDVVAPGQEIYSAEVDDYGYMSGTSMASPHASGVAGLIFAANPELSGADVKRILLASTGGRYYYYNGYSGLINAETAIINGLLSREHSVSRVIKADASDGLDLCFAVDTTGSMGDDIANAKSNMTRILDELTEKSDNFRVALIDYRDFPGRSASVDYPSKVQLGFSSDKDLITSAINGLTLGNGGDTPETVYSALMQAVGLDWRENATKAIIILGDAPPHDPEPDTGYTLNSVSAALYNADVGIILEESDDRVLGDAKDSLIKVFSIGTNASTQAAAVFAEISGKTGGSYTGVEDASGVSDAIIESIEKIEMIPTKTADAQFGADYSGETVEIYQDGKFAFEFVLDENGYKRLENMEFDRFQWEIPQLQASGSIRVNDKSKMARIDFDEKPWYSFALTLWHRERAIVLACAAGALIVLVLILMAISKLRRWALKRKAPAPEPAPASVPPPTPEPSPAPEPPAKHICPNCGAEYGNPVKFCGKCGASIQ